MLKALVLRDSMNEPSASAAALPTPTPFFLCLLGHINLPHAKYVRSDGVSAQRTRRPSNCNRHTQRRPHRFTQTLTYRTKTHSCTWDVEARVERPETILDGPGTTKAFEAPRRQTQTVARAPFMVLLVKSWRMVKYKPKVGRLLWCKHERPVVDVLGACLAWVINV